MIANDLEYVELSRANVSSEAISEFESGNKGIDLFFHENAIQWANKGIAVTYILVQKEEQSQNHITKIFAFSTISCSGLLYNSENQNLYMSCAEIKYFAIKKPFRGQTDNGLISGERYSKIFFKLFLQEMYFMSTSVIGFSMIFLQANTEGKHLYEDCNFTVLEDFLLPDVDDKIEICECTPMGMQLTDDNIYDLF